MPAQLIALNGGPNILVDKPILLLGRHPECDIQIESRKISRRHCCIAQVESYLVLRDLGSTNGVRINNARVVEGKIFPGDEVTIGNARYKVSWDSGIMEREPASLEKALEAVSPDDAMLEECDDPVPLDDPEDESSRGQATGPRTALEIDSEPIPEPTQESEQLILPENLELAPASDIHEPPPSSHP